ncbi:RNA methyltransferase [Poseidonibacter lekithochrous]|uniref:TrmH family RNA methyltransferase n=1 Tax=Poseidonibacter TaxID=2321187 RepID=UPI001C08E539|nr:MULTISPECIES: RNA methyltransferase [Poseidonibacter]MBU3015174.1 RNA methyltransferase [Poseidonibacter lekithochrous]MDO6828471.1 RNA methyltransferase [Poseidonibacter sp. 1_MG-2023]
MQEIISTKEVSDINEPQIKEFVSLRKSAHDEKYVVVESTTVFKKLFSANIKIHKVFTTPEHLDFIKQNCKNIDFEILTASNEIMKQIVGHKIHQGMLAVIDKPEFISFDEIQGNIVILNGLTSPENVGSIVRSCAAFSIGTLIIDEKTCSPFIRRCIRVSTGNLFNVNVYKSSDLKNDLKKLKQGGYTISTTANTPDAISLKDYTFPSKSGIVIGNEGFGVDKEIFELSDNILKIDIHEEVTSLNAAIATSIVLFKMSI